MLFTILEGSDFGLGVFGRHISLGNLKLILVTYELPSNLFFFLLVNLNSEQILPF